MLGEAMAANDQPTIDYCHVHMKEMRKIILEKYDITSAYMLEYIETYTTISDEEKLNSKNHNRGSKGDSNQRDHFYDKVASRDIKFGMYGNVNQKTMGH
jgi:hypothetical protein